MDSHINGVSFSHLSEFEARCITTVFSIIKEKPGIHQSQLKRKCDKLLLIASVGTAWLLANRLIEAESNAKYDRSFSLNSDVFDDDV